MPPFESPSHEEFSQNQVSPDVLEWNQSWNVETQLEELLSKIQTPELKALAKAEKQEFSKEVSQAGVDLQIELKEFQWDIQALDTIESNFSNFDNYSQFISFLSNSTGTGLSPNEKENFYTFITQLINNGELATLEMDFDFSWLPTTREEFMLLKEYDLVFIQWSEFLK